MKEASFGLCSVERERKGAHGWMIYIPAGDVDDLLVVLGVGVCASPINMEGK